MTVKFVVAQVLALGWLGVSVLLSLPWVRELAAAITMVPAVLVVGLVAARNEADRIQETISYIARQDYPGPHRGPGGRQRSRDNLWTRMQEWDYFLGIASVRRMQGLYQGTLVAQGAFSLYRTQALLEAGGWPDATRWARGMIEASA